MGFKNARENVVHGFGNLVVYLVPLEKFWKNFGNIFKGACTNADVSSRPFLQAS